jgi:hypothetical protein
MRFVINKCGTSYGLKHWAEDSIGNVTNGVFIAAAIVEGFTVRRNRRERLVQYLGRGVA